MIDIVKYDLYRGPNLGIYAQVNDEFVFIPSGFATTKAEKLSGYLKTDYLKMSMANTRLLGIMMVLNDHGILLPSTCTQDEFDFLKKSTDLNVGILDSKQNALGNLICANNKGGIISPAFSKEDQKKIQDVLDIEVIQKRIAGFHQTGVVIVTNSQGGIIHPETDDDDIKLVSNVLGTKMEPATINGGIPYVSSGVLVNNKAAVVGNLTSGPEIMMLTRAFSN